MVKEPEQIQKEYIERTSTTKAMIEQMKGVISPYDVVAVAEVLRNQPSADVVEVVRCKDCIEWRTSIDGSRSWCPRMWCAMTFEDDYCSFGVRK